MYLRRLQRIALIGSYLPRPCGIATFSGDVFRSLCGARGDWKVDVMALNDGGRYDYPAEVRFEIDQRATSYQRAARFLDANHYDAIFLQHEYGLFGGRSGDMLFELLDRTRIPLVSMLHTVLKDPDEDQFRVLRRLAARSSQVITMSDTGHRFLNDVFGVSDDRIVTMPHGIPDTQYVEPNSAKGQFDLDGRSVALTFGLLSPGKGIEHAIEALPAVVDRHPDLTYVLLGATHPHLVQREGERYRESLQRRVDELGLHDNVRFVNKFVEIDELTRWIAAADVYVTPYLNEAQITSGTLAYAYGCGKPVVSTPYWHAADLLRDGRGRLVPFRDPRAMSESLNELFDAPSLRRDIAHRAYAEGRAMTWPAIGNRMAECLEAAHNQMFSRVDAGTPRRRTSPRVRPAVDAATASNTGDRRSPWTDPTSTLRDQLCRQVDLNLAHLSAMTDDVGLVQHATFDLPNWHEGYCVDDNCRGLLLTTMMGDDRDVESDRLHRIYKTFVNYAVEPETGAVRNFMGFDRTWLERRGSDDSIGRVAWSLGRCVGDSENADDQDWAMSLIDPVVREAAATTSPRTWAFVILACDGVLRRFDGHREYRRMMDELADRFVNLYRDRAGEGWRWIEDIVTYDNAKIPESLLVAGTRSKRPELTEVGLEMLEWLTEVQTAPEGHFRPIGNDGFLQRGKALPSFDQQPLEAWATVSACLEAGHVTGEERWYEHGDEALAWFLGRNDLRTPVVDLVTGACHDGVQHNRINRNRGAESTLAWLLSVCRWQRERPDRDRAEAAIERGVRAV